MSKNLFRRIFQQSLIVKISLIIIVTTTALLAVFGFYQYQSSSRQMMQALQKTLDLTANRVAVSVRISLYQYDVPIVMEIIQSEMQAETLAEIIIAEQEKFSGFIRNPDGALVPAKAMLAEGGYLTARADIQVAEKTIGEVTVFGTRTALQQALRELWRLTMLQIIILDVVLVVILTWLIHTLFLAPLNTMVAFVEQVAVGDLTSEFRIKRHDEIGILAQGFQSMVSKITEVVTSVKMVAAKVALESRNLQTSLEQMSQGANEQAAVAEETSSSMEEMTANIRQNAENAETTEKIALQSAADAKQGGIAVSNTVSAMQTIEERIAVIQQIALQTNMLSLNATIEAAKAQEYGKGFAVVAAEVRSLAGHSRTAAEEIEKLVKSSVTISEDAQQILQRLVPNSEKTAELVQNILAASKEQQHGVDQINTSMQQLDRVIQENVANTEQLSVSAESLAAQAKNLQQLIAFFTVPEQPQEQIDKRQLLQQRLADNALDDDTVTAMLNILSESNRSKVTQAAESTSLSAQEDLPESHQSVSLSGLSG